MIPKIIHYCWFGRGPKPKDALRYIEGWKRLMPDYEILEWNEDNFDIDVCPYVKQAYEAKKFAFVSDYARGYALYKMGGVYLDTDVEVLKPFDDVLAHRSFWGFEAGNFIATSTIGAIREHEMIKAYLDQYHTRHFVQSGGALDTTTNVKVITQLWEKQGLLLNDEQQVVGEDNLFLPTCYLSPYDYRVGLTTTGDTTYAIHHYDKTWLGSGAQVKGRIKKWLVAVFGVKTVTLLQRILGRSFDAWEI